MTNTTIVNGVNFETLTIIDQTVYTSEVLNGYYATFVEGGNQYMIWKVSNGKMVRIETERDVKEAATKTLLAQSRMIMCELKGLS